MHTPPLERHAASMLTGALILMVAGLFTSSHLAARGESPAAFDRRCIPPDCVASRSNIPGILTRRALPDGRIAVLGATLHFHHGLLAAQGTHRLKSTPERREFVVSARDYTFTPPRLDVREHDIVRIVFHSADIAHSFTIDAYRISKRAQAGQTIVFEFLASHAGRFPIYCRLAADRRCRNMHAELLVTPADDEPE